MKIAPAELCDRRALRARVARPRGRPRPCRKLDRCGQRETSPSAARGDEWPRRAEAWGSLYRRDLALKEASGEPAERGLRRPPAGRGLSHIASRRRPSPRRPTGSDPASASRSSSRAGAAPCRQTGQAPHEARAAFLVPSWSLLGAFLVPSWCLLGEAVKIALGTTANSDKNAKSMLGAGVHFLKFSANLKPLGISRAL